MWTTPIPHSPMQAPDADVQYYVRKFGDEQPIDGKGYFPSRWPRATYAAMITYFDRQIGGLVAELKRLGIWENTVIVLTSDNGPASNSCSSSEWFDSAHPFRSGKGWGKSSLREGGIRCPSSWAWAANSARGKRPYRPISRVMPTLCDCRRRAPRDRRHFVPADPRRAQATAARISLLGVPRQQRLGSRPLGRMERFTAPCEVRQRPHLNYST